MKFNHTATAAAVVTGAAAQITTLNSSSAAPSYTIVTYVECTSIAAPTSTTTSTVTQTYCDLCSHMSTQVTAGQTNYVTAYTTVYTQVCPTGYTAQTYTITETCSGQHGAAPSFSGPSSGHVPPGFTTGLVPCTVCEATPITQVMTYPVTQGPTVPLSPAETPAPVGTPAPAAPTEMCETCQAGPAGSPLPAPAPYPVPAPAPAASVAPAPEVPSNSSAGLTPFNPNGARSLTIGFSTVTAVALGVLAFVL